MTRPTDADNGFAEPPDVASADSLSGQLLGAYKIVRRIGWGGMGQIYLAERDGDYRQQVAIKVLRQGLDSTSMRYRFRRERQILAGLEHPYIARLYGGGTTRDGRPYLVMERVDGSPIDQHCDDRRLSLEQRLKLFAKVCQAVAFAHRNQLVHRDIKPNNILVRDDGTPKLLDFGIAKSLSPLAGEDTTTAGQGPLTPGFASPEQLLGGHINTASDVYSLGVLLHHLLLGQGPARSARDLLEKRSIALPSQVLRQGITPQDLARRATLRHTDAESLEGSLRGDLDHILLRALHPESTERYPSALELARDVERYLTGYPLASRRTSMRDVVVKLVRRNRQVTAIALGILVVLSASLWRVESSRRDVEKERQRMQQVRHFLLQVFDTGPGAASRPDPAPLQLVQLAEQRLARMPDLEPEVDIVLRHALGQIYDQLTHHEQAVQLIGQALVAHRRIHGDDSVDAAPLLTHLAHVEHRLGLLAASEMHYREAMALASDRRRNRHQRRRAAEVLSDANYGLSSIRWDQGKLRECEALMRQALSQRRQLYDGSHRRIIDVVSDLATLLIADHRFEEGEALLLESMEMRRQSLGEHHPSMFYSRDSLGLFYYKQGLLEQAESVYRQTLEWQGEAMTEDHPHRRLTLRHLARALLAAGKLDEAHRVLQDLLRIEGWPGADGVGLEGLGDDPLGDDGLRDSLQLMGRVLNAQGRYADALPHLQRVVESRSRGDRLGYPSQGLSLYSLAQAESGLGREIAEQHFRQALRLLEASGQRYESLAEEVRLALSHHLLAAGRPDAPIPQNHASTPQAQGSHAK